ncbi:MAG: PhoX family phosphatase [Polaromonas sp.]
MTFDNNSQEHSHIDPDDLDKNTSGNPSMHDVLAARLHRRHVLKGGVGAITMASLGTLGLTACATGPGASSEPVLGFKAVGKATTDRVTVPEGYTATVIYATGDSIDPTVSDYKNDGTDGNFARRSGDHHDGIHFFGLTAAGLPSTISNERALLVINHENISGTARFLHPNGQTANSGVGPRPEGESLKEIEAHGVSIIELAKTAGKFGMVKASGFNRRITAATPMDIAGPARGTAFMKTKFSTNGTQTRGTINNCGHGYTPWGTYLTAEENWAGYFTRGQDAAVRSPKENAALLRNGIKPGRTGVNRWTTTVAADPASTAFSRWDCTATTALPADGTGDFRNEANTFGYIVEIDPYSATSTPAKRTALGRRANEGAWPSLAIVGRPLAFYMGCDSRGEYVYKFVSKKLWQAADANRADRMKVGAEYMDEGTIYAARFNADGTGTWVKLDMSNPDVAAGVPVSTLNPAGYKFESQADICVNTRLAADAAKATRMDRPEWTAVNPKNGEIYITMTENPDRGNTTTVSNNNFMNPDVDAANPRYWLDSKEITSQNAARVAAQKGNVNGHIMRIRETNDNAGAESFKWDIFLFGAQAVADAGIDNVNWQQNVNLSQLSPMNDLSKPDGCWFSKASGVLWIQTDDNTFTDQSNAMLLAAVPGNYGDGGVRTVVNKANGSPNAAVTTDKVVTTYAGKPMTETTFKRFLTAPLGAEVTGLTESPDGKALFINIQHPGENTTSAGFAAKVFESNWPGNGSGVPAYGPGGASARPRSATIVITKNDGGVIGL